MGVSAETGQENSKDYTPTVIPKSDAVRSRIAAATEKNALFAGLGKPDPKPNPASARSSTSNPEPNPKPNPAPNPKPNPAPNEHIQPYA